MTEPILLGAIYCILLIILYKLVKIFNLISSNFTYSIKQFNIIEDNVMMSHVNHKQALSAIEATLYEMKAKTIIQEKKVFVKPTQMRKVARSYSSSDEGVQTEEYDHKDFRVKNTGTPVMEMGYDPQFLKKKKKEGHYYKTSEGRKSNSERMKAYWKERKEREARNLPS